MGSSKHPGHDPAAAAIGAQFRSFPEAADVWFDGDLDQLRMRVRLEGFITYVPVGEHDPAEVDPASLLDKLSDDDKFVSVAELVGHFEDLGRPRRRKLAVRRRMERSSYVHWLPDGSVSS